MRLLRVAVVLSLLTATSFSTGCNKSGGDTTQIGVITSGTRSPTLRKNVALCRMATQFAEVGTEVEVGKLDGHQKRIPATVVPCPFYDPKKERPRS